MIAADLEVLFRVCFLGRYRTILVGGGEEPVYLPSENAVRTPHRIVYREDYFASALHEVAHWCLAGRARRQREDYGYWYAPDGRSAEMQAEFERVEARPQALESIFSAACDHPFVLSADNLEAGMGVSSSFEASVMRERKRFESEGLPPRARVFRDALARAARARLQ